MTQNVAYELFICWHFSSIFVRLKVTCLITLFDRKPQVFKNSPKLTFFVIFIELLPTQNVNVACFAHSVEWDFFCDFQTTVAYPNPNNKEHLSVCLSVCSLYPPLHVTPDPLDRFWWNFLGVMNEKYSWKYRERVVKMRMGRVWVIFHFHLGNQSSNLDTNHFSANNN